MKKIKEKLKGFTLIELIAVVVLLGIIGLITYPAVTGVINDSKDKAYNTQIEMIEEAGKKWGVDNTDKLHEWNVNIINLDDLIAGGYINKTENGVLIDPRTNEKLGGCVLVSYSKSYNQYEYKYDAECTQPETLVSTLIKQYNESNTTGLLKDADGYYYKGTKEQVTNNFIWFAGHLWRIVNIDNDNNLTLITQQPLTAIYPASKVWTTEQEYKNSYINNWLNNVFLASMENEDKEKLVNNTFNVGGLYNSTTRVVENIDSIQVTQKVGLLDETQYKKAGSYLNISDYFWLGNRYDTTKIRNVHYQGTVTSLSGTAETTAVGVRPVVKISNLIITKGDGTISNPYRTEPNTTSTSNIKVGEYVSVPTTGNECGTDKRCLFRVVSKDNNSIKVTLNGLLATDSSFGTYPYKTNNTMDKNIKKFADTIDSKYRYTGNKVFNIGLYNFGANYTDTVSLKYSGSVGLPITGEMFSGNDFDLMSYKTFVNTSTIENNDKTMSFFLLMNGANDLDEQLRIHYISYDGVLVPDSFNSTQLGVRPVLFLNKGLTFTSGEGTAENPFTVE